MKREESAGEDLVSQIMIDFARSTGLVPESGSPVRYLWTDAFAVCNFLGLYRSTGEGRYLDLALALVDQTHHVLGRHRSDDRRTGWISGLGEKEGSAHPTKGGLRIGKELKERRAGEPFDERLEWDRDGQYYHYLTKWMHALNRVTNVTGDHTFNRWALELARIASARFVYEPPRGGPKRMAWKMSIDLSRPLVPHMGQHDPLDGLITYTQIEATALKDPKGAEDLRPEIAVLLEMCKGRGWMTDDPLGLGSLLSDAYRVAQLMAAGYFLSTDLLLALLDTARPGLEAFLGQGSLQDPADYRLPFRELGLSIGLKAVEALSAFLEGKPQLFEKTPAVDHAVRELLPHTPLAATIEGFWCEPEHRQSESWTGHRDINEVMLATSLAPDGFLELI